jgi:hypothetical protein
MSSLPDPCKKVCSPVIDRPYQNLKQATAGEVAQ